MKKFARFATEAEFGWDWKKLVDHYRRIEPVSGRVARRKPKRTSPVRQAKK